MGKAGGRREEPAVLRLPVFFGSGFHPIHCTAWGAPDSPRGAVCVHSFLMNGREFDPLAAALAREGWRVICPDLPGHGRSRWCEDASGYRFPLHAATLAAAVAALGSTRVDLIGASMGAVIALRLAACAGAPFRSLVLNDMASEATPEAIEQVVASLPQQIVFDDIATAVRALRRLVEDRGPVPPEDWPDLVRAFLAKTRDGYRFRFDPRLLTQLRARPFHRPESWGAVSIPTLLVRGAHSLMLPAAAAAAMVADRQEAELLTLADGGHPSWLRTPDQIGPIVDWLKRRPD